MALTTAGLTEMVKAIIGEAITAFSNANAHIGVGDSTTAFSAAHTDLQASTNKLRVAMESSYPSRSGLVVTFRSLFDTGDANFAWAEWAIFNASSTGTMLSRKVEALGTKTSAQQWQVDGELTFALG